MKKFTCFIIALVFLGFHANSQGIVDLTLGQDNSGAPPQTGIILPDNGQTDAPAFESMCDNFDYANTSTIPGWTEQSGDWSVFDNKLKTPGTFAWQYITMDGSSQSDGCITLRAIYSSQSDVQFVGVVGRFTFPESHILFKIQDNIEGAPDYWNSIWLYIGENSNPYYLTGLDLGTDAIIQMEYLGSDVTVRVDKERDGIWEIEHTATVSNTDFGLCGVGGWANSYGDEFCCGEDCIQAVVPVSNYAIVLAVVLIGAFIALRRFRVI